MKYTLAALLLVASLHASAQDSMKISGKINMPVVDSISVIYNNSKIMYDPKVYTAKLKGDGSFSMAFPTPSQDYTEATIKNGMRETDFFVSPGYDLTITATGKTFDTSLHYKGQGSEVENFLARHAIESGRLNGFGNLVKPLMTYDSIKYVGALEHLKDRQIAYMEKNGTGLPAPFRRYYTAYYTYYNYFFLMQYPIIHEMTKQNTRNITHVTHENYLVLHRMPYEFSDSFLNVTPYLLYVNNIFPSKLNEAGYTYENGDTIKQRKIEDSIAKLAYKHLPEKTSEYFFAQDLYAKARMQPVEKSRKELAFFKKNWRKSEYLPLLERQVGIAERLAPGQPAPDFNITTETGMKMKLSDLKGHVVYLTFWSTSCKQCVGEMISEKKMKDLMKDKPVSFVYVNLSDDTTAKKIIDHYKVDGIFTAVHNSWQSKEVDDYGVQGLPSYYLIDEEGKFAMQVPPTPRQETELILAIGKLLK
jgi:thiol-disulfide isomerase/thioredoxin